jgi:hypothetical protein
MTRQHAGAMQSDLFARFDPAGRGFRPAPLGLRSVEEARRFFIDVDDAVNMVQNLVRLVSERDNCWDD